MRKIQIMKHDDRNTLSWFWCILAWSDGPTYYDGKKILPGTEHGSWYNAACGWEDTPENAFASAMKRL